MKNFIVHDIPKIKRVDSDNGRVYQTPSGQAYPSVTSVTGLTTAKYIHEWRQRVGAEEANRITSRASKRGTAIHSLCENYLLGNNPTPNLADHEMWSTLKPHLDRIDNIHCLETQLFSHHLGVAGTVDCIAEYDGRLSVIDFKTSGRIKSRDDIHTYFMQTSAYAVMFEELTGVPVNRLVIIMGVDNEDALIFQEKRNVWIGEFKRIREDYKRIKGL